MSRPATPIVLPPEEETALRRWARPGNAEHRYAERAQIILCAAQGEITTTRASWVNQVECLFSILRCGALRAASFTPPQEFREAIDRSSRLITGRPHTFTGGSGRSGPWDSRNITLI